LTDLQLDYLDLYLIHWPVIQDVDDDTKLLPLEGIPIAETWKALEACVDKGLVRDIGVSNFSCAKLKSLWETARIKPSVNQVERHPYLQQPKLVKFCKEHGIVLTAYSPLGKGTRYSGTDAGSLLDDETIIAIATKHGVMPAQILICWAVACGTGVIPKSAQKHRLQENFESTKVTLDANDMAKLTAIDKHHRYVDGTAWCGEGSPYTLANLWDEA
jgi:alcohol dehydrogenase (NADP+)